MVSGVRPWKLSNMDLESYRPKLNEKESSLSIRNALKIETNESQISGIKPFVSATTKVNSNFLAALMYTRQGSRLDSS